MRRASDPPLPADLAHRLTAFESAPADVRHAVDIELAELVEHLRGRGWLRWWHDGARAPDVANWSRVRLMAELPTLARWLPWTGRPTRFDLFTGSFEEHDVMCLPAWDAQVWEGDPAAVKASVEWFLSHRTPMAPCGEPLHGLPDLARALARTDDELAYMLLCERADQADRGPFSLTDPPLEGEDDGPDDFDLKGVIRRDLTQATAHLVEPTLIGLTLMMFEGNHNDTLATALVASR